MKVIHIESGLGNQMLSYCEYLALRKANPDDEFYIENIIYDIPESDEAICQWNGYELERIFGIKEPQNIKTIFTDTQWEKIIEEIKNSHFWEKNWNYPVYFTKALNNSGLKLTNIRGNFEAEGAVINIESLKKETFYSRLKKHQFFHTLKYYYHRLRKKHIIAKRNNVKNLFYKTNQDLFTGQWLSFKYIGNNRESIEDEINKTFIFPEFDEKNKEMSEFLSSKNSVAIHARRGDMLSVNGWCYKYGYFKRAVKHIRKNVKDPVFVFFTNTGSVEWCKENASIFGLDYSKDKVYFVDWNKGSESYRDMQLMGCCKHAIITNSTFGWWGAYFIKNPNKITISPSIDIDTTFHC